jgi:hypothetical protein
MTNQPATYLLLLLLGASACSTTQTLPYQSKWNAPFNYTEGLQPDQQDQRSRLKYGIINDDQYVYLTLKTQDPYTVKQILSNGLRVSFSPPGGRRDGYSLLFPVVSPADRKAMRNMEVDLPNSLSMNRMLDVFNKEALWKGPQGERFVNLVTANAGIRAQLSMNQNGELTEQITIPLTLLGLNPDALSTLGVAIRAGGAGGAQGGLSPRISVGMGGGMGGFGMGGGGVGVGLGSGNRNGQPEREVDIRLQVNLARGLAD